MLDLRARRLASLAKMVWNRNFDTIRVILAERGLPMGNRPKFFIQQKKINNPQVNAQVLQIALASGIAVKTQQAYELLELEQPAEDDDVIVGINQPLGQPPLGGLPELPGGDGAFPFRSRQMKMREFLKQRNGS